MTNVIICKEFLLFSILNGEITGGQLFIANSQPNKIWRISLFTSDWLRFVTFIGTYEWYKPKPVTWEK